MKIIPSIFNSSVVAAQSTRLGGVSISPYDSLNLGKSTNDLPENIIQNRKLFFGSLEIPAEKISLSKQVHGSEILVVNEPVITEGYDAMITTMKNIFLAVSIADCVPVLIHDSRNNVVAAIHAGWRGTVDEIVLKTIQKMKLNFGTRSEDCFAFIGACIGFNAFEVGDEVARRFNKSFKREGQNNKFYVDLKSANQDQLERSGVKKSHIEISEYCTVQHNDMFFSHRNERGITGRMMAVIGMR